MKNKNLLSIVLGLLVCTAATLSQAATYDNPIEGRLKSVYSDFITIKVFSESMKSPDMNKTNGGDLAFKMDSQTGYENFHKLTDLQEGDKISIKYKKLKGKNTAVMISKLDSGPAPVEVVQQRTTTTTTTTVISP